MNFLKNIIRLISIIGLTLIILHNNSQAASGHQGYAVYRDGVSSTWVTGGWHAGIMNNPTKSGNTAIIHIPGPGKKVSFTSWSGFKGSNNYKYAYYPKQSVSSTHRNNFLALGRKLVDQNIGYNIAYQVWYTGGADGTKVTPAQVSSMRCDGVVEYIYEYYGYKVFGSSSYWDITKNKRITRGDHSGVSITPIKQAQNYLKLISTNSP